MSPSAGPLALARDILDADSSPFFVLNSDVICNYPFTKMLEAHKAHGKEGTIVVSSITYLTRPPYRYAQQFSELSYIHRIIVIIATCIADC